MLKTISYNLLVWIYCLQVLIVIKVCASFTFLLPFLLDQDENTRPFIYQFFAVFFPVLIVETIIILQMVKYAELKKVKKEENL